MHLSLTCTPPLHILPLCLISAAKPSTCCCNKPLTNRCSLRCLISTHSVFFSSLTDPQVLLSFVFAVFSNDNAKMHKYVCARWLKEAKVQRICHGYNFFCVASNKICSEKVCNLLAIRPRGRSGGWVLIE